jgi:MoxR-like ATPase
VPKDEQIMESLVFDTRFHNVDQLISTVPENILNYKELNAFSAQLQDSISASATLRKYALDLWRATKAPLDFGVKVSGVDMNRLVLSGASPRGMGMLLRAARVNAWLNNRDAVLPDDIHAVFHETIAHRVVFSPVYEMRRTEIAREMLNGIVNVIAAP